MAEPDECRHVGKQLDLNGPAPVMRCMVCDQQFEMAFGPGPAVIRRDGDPGFNNPLGFPYLETASGAFIMDAHDIEGHALTGEELRTVHEFLARKHGIGPGPERKG